MSKKKFTPTAEFPYHITARCLNKEWFSMPLNEIWNIFSDYLFFIHHAFNVHIHSFVLMNNHFHLILHTPNANLDKAMNYFMRETSRVINKNSGRINQIYGAPYHWSILKFSIYYLHTYKYVYRNPVEAGLARFVEEYKFSTLQALIGQTHTIIPLENDDTLFSNFETQLQWLNKTYFLSAQKEDIKKALRKREFKFGKNNDRRSNVLETNLI